MSINIPENVDVLLVRTACRTGGFPSNITFNHVSTGSFFNKRLLANDSNLHAVGIFELITPPPGPATLYIRNFIEGTDRFVVDYLKNVNIKTGSFVDSFTVYTSTASISLATGVGDIILDVIAMPSMSAFEGQITQIVIQDDENSPSKWYGTSYKFATSGSTTVGWTSTAGICVQGAIVYKPSPGGRIDVISEGQNQIIVSSNPSEGNLITVV